MNNKRKVLTYKQQPTTFLVLPIIVMLLEKTLIFNLFNWMEEWTIGILTETEKLNVVAVGLYVLKVKWHGAIPACNDCLTKKWKQPR